MKRTTQNDSIFKVHILLRDVNATFRIRKNHKSIISKPQYVQFNCPLLSKK